MLLDVKLFYKAIVIKIAWHWPENIHSSMKQNNQEINPHLCDQLIYDKRGKNVRWGKNSLFNEWCWGNEIDTCKK